MSFIENYNFVYSGTAFDKKGIVYWIGTNKGTEPFKNPVERDFGIKCRRSSGTTGSVLHDLFCFILLLLHFLSNN